MKRIITLYGLMALFFAAVSAKQPYTQTVRGVIIDADNKLPLTGASVIIANSDPVTGTITDINGIFRLENVPVGRITLQISFMGYEDNTISNIVVNSEKEVVLQVSMQESLVQLNEVVVKAYKQKGTVTNEMSLLSSRSISVDETSRFTGGMNDPSRVVSNYAGVTSTPDGSTDIIVRKCVFQCIRYQSAKRQ